MAVDLENVKQLDSLLKSEFGLITAKTFANRVSISIENAKNTFNHYMTAVKSSENYIFLFKIELIDGNTLKTILLPSYSHLLESCLTKFDILDFSVFAIAKKEGFQLKLFSSLVDEEQANEGYQVNFVNKDTPILKMKNNPVQRTENQKELKTEPHKIPINNNVNQIKNNVKTEPHKINGFAKNNKGTNSFQSKINQKISFEQEKIEKNNQENVNVAELKSDFDNQIQIQGDNLDEEFYYGGSIEFIKKEEIKENQEDQNTFTSKRKASPVKDEEPVKKKKIAPNQSETAYPIKKSFEEKIEVVEKEIPKEVKRVKKTRKVIKTMTYKDEKGYLVTKEELVDEVYSSDEFKPEKPSNNRPLPVENNAKGKNNKAVVKNTSILNFFKK